MEKQNVVVLGAGFGGVTAAIRITKGLRRANLLDRYAVTLIDRNDCQVYTPNLYEYAAEPGNTVSEKICLWHIPSLLGDTPIAFLQGEMTSLDLAKGEIRLASGNTITAAFLVLALGSETNDFGITGIMDHAIPLKTFNDAERIRARLKNLLAASTQPRIVVGGGGPNGVEIAAQIKFLHPNCGVTIVEAAPAILGGFEEKTLAAATKRLAKLGVQISCNAKIARVDEHAVQLADGNSIPFDLMIWTGGVRTSHMIAQLPLRENRGKPVADSDMLCLPETPDLKIAPMVYALGDSACFLDPSTQKPMPATAPVAIEEGEIAARNVVEEILQKEKKNYVPHLVEYAPKKYPYVIPVGGPWAIAKVGGITFTGRTAWIFKQLVALDYLMTALPFGRALKEWV